MFDDVKEVFDICKVIVKYSKYGFGIYIILMVSELFDVMVV